MDTYFVVLVVLFQIETSMPNSICIYTVESVRRDQFQVFFLIAQSLLKHKSEMRKSPESVGVCPVEKIGGFDSH